MNKGVTVEQVTSLLNLHDELASYCAYVKDEDFRSRSIALASSEATLEAVDSFIENSKNKPPLRTSVSTVKRIRNTLKGLTDGVLSKEIKITQYRTTVASQIEPLVVENLQTAVAAVEAALGTDPEDLSKSEANDKRLDGLQSQHSQLLKRYKGFQSKLPSKLNHEFDVVSCSIVPLMADFHLMNTSKLTHIGIPFTSFDQLLTVLDEQVLLAFDKTKANLTTDKRGKVAKDKWSEKNALTGKMNKSARTPRARKDRDKRIEDYVVHLLNMINQHSGRKYDLVSSHFHYNHRNKDIRFAWIMERSAFSKLTRSLHDSHGLQGTWGFPWQHDVTADW